MKAERMKQLLCDALAARLAGKSHNPPAATMPIWNAFQRLSERRSYNAAGPNPIPFTEIVAYANLFCLPLEPHHVSAIIAMDGVWLEHAYARQRAPEGVRTMPPVSQAPLSAALLDAILG